ncbi:MAG: lytic transglycosylase domain-containing protein [Bdellovibrionaceae bacterium]|nr:lytic transglycosylase domain-containing protein [Bdellovibrionales bacterium]MCB9084887.1 lytic transglycosylase domain-containing protein [Pseudobdellovibrionaceae bacterium]
MFRLLTVLIVVVASGAQAAIPGKANEQKVTSKKSTSVIHLTTPVENNRKVTRLRVKTKSKAIQKNTRIASSIYSPVDRRPNYDLPITYNSKVRFWINYYQKGGQSWFKRWMERSYRYLPQMQAHMKERGIPQDLAFVAMIESGFSPHAKSDAEAVGYWQFIKSTASRYGLRINWWLDERRDFTKSTRAAASYLNDLYKMFDSWYLTAAAYNMGEGRLRKLIQKYKTDNFWVLSKKRDFPEETREYIPKLLAAMLISKSPALYGFHKMEPKEPYSYEYFSVPGGTDLYSLSKHLKVPLGSLKKLNPELLHSFIPSFVNSHRIRIPRGTTTKVSQYVRQQMKKRL